MGKRKDLDAVYRQLLLYRGALGNPPPLVFCDIDRYEVHTNFTRTMPRVHRFTNEDIPAGPEPLSSPRAPSRRWPRRHGTSRCPPIV